MLCLDEAIALAFSLPSRLFVFIFIYWAEKLCVLFFSNILHTHSVTDIKTWELPNATTVWCQSAAPSEQSAIKHLAQGHLQRSCCVSFASLIQIFLAPPVTSVLFESSPPAICSTSSLGTVCFSIFFLLAHYPNHKVSRSMNVWVVNTANCSSEVL